MIKAVFQKDAAGHYTGYTCKGHAGFADKGSDIICASFSTMTNLLLAFTESHGKCDLDQENNLIAIYLNQGLPEKEREFLDRVFEQIRREMEHIAKDYPQNVAVFLRGPKPNT